MSLEGRIAVDVNFIDTASGAATVAKRIQLAGSTDYSSGKVAVVTGTCGTADSVVDIYNPTFRGANGEYVVFDLVSKVSFCASGARPVRLWSGANAFGVVSSNGAIAVTGVDTNTTAVTIALLDATAGTAAYTAVVYGS